MRFGLSLLSPWLFLNATLALAAPPSYVNDHGAPVITFTPPASALSRTRALRLPIQVQDASPVTTTVYLNGALAATNTRASFTAALSLVEGPNTVEIRSVDANQNQATRVTAGPYTLDTTAAILTVPPAGRIASWSVPVSGSSNEALASATLNGAPLTLAADGKSFSGAATATRDGNFALRVRAVDLAGNASAWNGTATLDTQGPKVSVGKLPALTRVATQNLTIKFSDPSGVTARVRLNGTEVAVLTASPSVVALTLAEGPNQVRVEAVDSLGNVAAPVLAAPAVLDTTAPTLGQLLPTAASVIHTVEVPVSGQANEPLKSITVNNQRLNLGADQKSFSGTRRVATGDVILRWQATDLAGNASTQEVPILVDTKPVIRLGLQDPVLTHATPLSLPVRVYSASAATTTVLVNGVQKLQTTQTEFTASLPLNEGLNRIEVRSRNAANQIGTPAVLAQVTLDRSVPVPPILSTTQVDHALTAQALLQVPVHVQSSAATTAEVVLNGAVVVTSDQKDFIANVTLALGRNELEIRATDAFGQAAPPIRLLDLVYDAPTPVAGPVGNTVAYPAQSLPSALSDALRDKLSLATSLLARVTHRTDPVACTGGQALQPPSDPAWALLNVDPLTEATPEVLRLAGQLPDAAAAFSFVRNQIEFLPRFGLTQTAAHAFEAGVGTAADKASALVTLLRIKGVPARFIAGEAWVAEDTLRGLYGVESAYDLAWAQITSLKGYFQARYPQSFDPERMVVYRDGQRLWHVPHVWVQAYVQGRWLELDPTYAGRDRVFGGGRLLADSRTYVERFLFDGQARFYGKDLADYLVYGASDPQQGTQDLGRSITPEFSVLPEGTLSDGPPCIHAQAEMLPDEYLFKSYVRVGEAPQPLLQGSQPLALAHANPWGVTHPIVHPETGERQYALRAGVSVRQTAPVPAEDFYDVFHAIQAPAVYGGAAEVRTTPRINPNLDTVLSHQIAPTTLLDYLRHTRAALDGAGNYEHMRLIGALALLRGAEQNRLINGLRNTVHAAENLVATSSEVMDFGVPIAIGRKVFQGQIDWLMAGPLYSRAGGYEDFNAYANIGYAKGELVVANSSLEGQIWEDLYDVNRRGVSAVSILQEAGEALLHPESASNLPPGTELIRGEQLSATDNEGLFARFRAPMQLQVPFINRYVNERPYLFTMTDATVAHFWNGTAYILLPSTPMGHAGAFLSNTGTAPLLGGSASSECPYSQSSTSFSMTCTNKYENSVNLTPSDLLYTAHIDITRLAGTCDGQSTACVLEQFQDGYSHSQDVEDLTCSFNWASGGTCRYCVSTGPGPYGGGHAPTFSSSCSDTSLAAHSTLITLAGLLGANGFMPPPLTPTIDIGTNSSPPGLGAAAGGEGGSLAGTQNPNLTPNNSSSPPGGCTAVGQPVNPVSGAMWHHFLDFEVAGRTPTTALRLDRNYLSRSATISRQFGPQWSSNWDTRLYVGAVQTDPLHSDTGLPPIVWVDEWGGPWTFVRAADSTLVAPPGLHARLLEQPNGYELTLKDGVKYLYTRQDPSLVAGTLKAIVEPHGERLDFGYDGQGRLETVTTALAGTARLARDATSGLVTTVTRERDGLAYHYTYDAEGRLASVADFEGLTTRYEYNSGQLGTRAHGLLSAIQDPIGRRITFTYYSNGQAFEQTEPGQGYRAFFYSAAPTKRNYTRMLDIDGRGMEYRYDAVGQVTDLIYPDSSRVSHEWDGYGHLTTRIDETGKRWPMGYDEQGNLRFYQERGAAVPTTVAYEGTFSKPVSILRPNGATETLTVDPATGDVTLRSVQADQNFQQAYALDPYGNVTSVNNGLAIYSFGRDGDGLLTQVPDLHNPETRAYDSRRRLSKRTFASGRVLTYGYDTHDRLTSVGDSHGPSLSITYDIVGRMLTKTVSDGTTSQVTSYGWDERDRLATQTDALGRVTHYQYDRVAYGCNVQDVVASITDPAGRKTRFEYDNRQRLIRRVDALGAVTRYDYNARGDLTGITDAVNNRTVFSYNPNGNLIKRERPSVYTDAEGHAVATTEVTDYSYDAEGHLLRQEAGSANSVKKAVTEWTYNPLGRITTRKVSWHYTDGTPDEVQDDSSFSYEPILDTQLLKTANNGNAQLSFTSEFQPPFAQAGYQVAATQVGNPLGIIEDTFTLNRDATGEIASIIRASDPANALIAAQHDPAARLTQMIGKLGSQSLTSTIAYDGMGRKRSVIHNTGMIGSFSYDLLNRITSVAWTGTDGQSAQNFSEALSYGALTGNVDQVTRELGVFNFGTDAVDQVTSLAFTGAAALPAGVVNRTIAYDLNHNRSSSAVVANTLVSDAAFVYQTDSTGLGTQTKRVNRSTLLAEAFSYSPDLVLTSYDSGSGKITSYSRDALGRVIVKSINQGGAAFTQSLSYLGDSADPLLAKSGDGTTFLYLHGQEPAEHFGHVTSGGARSYTTDHVNSVLNTEVAGAAHTLGTFGEALGAQPLISAEADPVSYGWQGMPLDRESGDYRPPFRQYNPASGRWTTPDPIGFAGGTPNLFEAMGNNPLIFTDPSGLKQMCDSGPPNDNDSISPTISPVDIAIGGGAYASTLKLISGTATEATTAIGGVITGYTRHGLERAISRDGTGVSPRAILDAVRNPTNVVQQNGGTTKFFGNSAEVVVNSSGKVVTTIPKSSSGFRSPR